MTRDEVMAMTDEELQIKAAELMGWNPPETDGRLPDGLTYHCDSDGTEYYTTSLQRKLGNERLDCCSVHRAYFWHSADGVNARTDSVPNYPNDIAAAWPLLGKLYGRRGIACIETYMTDGECQVTLWTAMQNTVVLRQWKEGDRPEQAITRAFIIAMEENHG